MRIVWIGGGTSAGKTSIARAIAKRYGLTSYHIDAHEADHAERGDPERHPAMQRWNTRTLDETWIDLPVSDLVEQTFAYSRERIEFIGEDLAALSGRGAVVEGFQLTPEVVAPLIESSRQAVWLLPTPDFRQQMLLGKPDAWVTPNRTRDPARAQAHRFERDGLVVQRVREQALAHRMCVIDVDGSRPLEDVEAAVEDHLEPYLR